MGKQPSTDEPENMQSNVETDRYLFIGLVWFDWNFLLLYHLVSHMVILTKTLLEKQWLH